MAHRKRRILAQLEGVRLRRTTERDLDAILAFERAPAQAQLIFAAGRAGRHLSLVDPDLLHAVVESGAGQPVGFVLLAGLTNAHQSVELRRIVIGDVGKGYGRRALRMVKRLAFEEFAAHRLWLDVFEHNLCALHLYGSEGFIIDGRLRDCYRWGDGGFDSPLVMSLLRHEYLACGAVAPSHPT
jgi:diamine N-acetyltransferase